MRWYWLALLIWFIEILMFVSILLIPVVVYARDNNDWFHAPFRNAWWNSEYDRRE